MSRKRILPAFVLCFVLCGHRIYAGRYVSGIVQLVLTAGASLWVWVSYKGLIDIINSTPHTLDAAMDMVDRAVAWKEANNPSAVPVFLVLAIGIWVALDAAKLVAGKFNDGQGSRITKWM